MGLPLQVTSVWAEEITTSAIPLTTTWRALTVMSPFLPLGELCCSLMTTWPSGKVMAWLGCPETTIVCPLMSRLTMSELPLTEGPPGVHMAIALATSKLAAMVFAPTVRLRSAVDASERLRSPWPILVA